MGDMNKRGSLAREPNDDALSLAMAIVSLAERPESSVREIRRRNGNILQRARELVALLGGRA